MAKKKIIMDHLIENPVYLVKKELYAVLIVV